MIQNTKHLEHTVQSVHEESFTKLDWCFINFHSFLYRKMLLQLKDPNIGIKQENFPMKSKMYKDCFSGVFCAIPLLDVTPFFFIFFFSSSPSLNPQLFSPAVVGRGKRFCQSPSPTRWAGLTFDWQNFVICFRVPMITHVLFAEDTMGSWTSKN